ncbi:MAG TPA: hypothetical protein VFU47_04210 [Armatimonadota bacterium]|nr:hypothetical protein [Armatimonadota bacterium]
MPSRDLETNIDGDPTGWNRALKSAERQAAKFRKEVERLEGKLKSHQATTDKAAKSANLMRGELATLVAAGAAVSPAFLAAGAGVAAFAAMAVPSILKVVKAQEDLAENWSSLSGRQKISAAATKNLIDQYKDLADALEPEVLRNYNTALGITAALMPKLQPLAREGAKAFQDFQNKLATALDSRAVSNFFRFLEKEARPGMDAVGDATLSLIGTVGSLVQALAPLATSGLGLVTMLSDLVGAITTVSPEMAQLVTLAVALRGPLSALGGTLGPMAKGAAKAGEGAAKAGAGMKALNLVAKAGPGLLMGAGLALAFFAVKAATAKSSTDKLVDTMRALHQAVGNNLAGYDAMNRALDAQVIPATARAAQAQKDMAANTSFMSVEVAKGAAAAETLTRAWTDEAKAANNLAKSNITAGAKALADQYGITANEAIALADAIGVDLSKGVLENGRITATTAARFQSYIAAVELARNPTAMIGLAWQNAANEGMKLEDRIKGITGALDALFNPSISVYQAQTAMRNALVEAKKALDGSNGSLSLATEKGRAARDAFANYAQAVSTTAQRTYDFTSRTQGAQQATQKARDAVLAQLPTLANLAGKSKSAQDQVANLAVSYGITGKQAADAGVKTQGLIDKINNLHSKKVDITANTAAARAAVQDLLNRMLAIKNKTVTITAVRVGDFSTSAPGAGRALHASGGYISGPGTGTSDSIPAMLSNGEYVINAAATSRHRDLLEAINAGRYASGGLVKGYASGGSVSAADVPLSDFVSRYMGKTATAADVKKASNARKDAVDQLRKAERKLAEDRKKHRSARTIKDDEARVAKERRDLAAATDKLKTAEANYKKTKAAPSTQLQNALTLGIKNTKTFIKNIQTLASKGYGALAQALLAQGGPEAERFAADAVKLSATKLKKLNADVQTSAKYQAQLEQLPAILKIQDAITHGAKTIPGIMQYTGLSEDEIAAANQVQKMFARGGIQAYASGGLAPGVASGPVALFGEGRGKEAYIPYDRAYRSRAMGLVNQVASDFGMTRRAYATAPGLAERVVHHVSNHVTIQGAMDPVAVGREVEKVLNRLSRDRGRTTLSFTRR